MALIRSQWRKLDPVSVAETDEAIKEWLKDFGETDIGRGVYVIRLARPYTIVYPKENRKSPVLYIGEGSTKKRLEKHLATWVRKFGRIIPSALIDARVTEPRVQRNYNAYREVEADLLSYFCEKYGSLPLFNSNREMFGTPNRYTRQFMQVLDPGRGRGYEWALTPLGNQDPTFSKCKPWREVAVER